jgi:hypothetical protein
VYGRDELCRVLIEAVRDRRTRRPHVVIGSVGTGRTALLVQLTKLLAEQRVVPVPITLREAKESLDFAELAHKRFLSQVDAAFFSDADVEKLWRQLRVDDKIVVLADNLEEALIGSGAERTRDNLIMLSIQKANETRLPVIMVSRPHFPLRYLEAAVIVELEPLSDEAALQYLWHGVAKNENEQWLQWVVEVAGVAEAPLYLQITRQLHEAKLMEYVAPLPNDRRLDTHSVDREELRLRLLEVWMQALISGFFPRGLPLSREDRQATVEQLSLIACIGVQQDRVVFDLDDVWSLSDPALPIVAEVHERLSKLKRRFDLRQAAAWGTRLGLVEPTGDVMRFRHNIMQAYLASRLIDVAMSDAPFRDKALRSPGPGRELLIALVMHSRAQVHSPRSGDTSRVRSRAAQYVPEAPAPQEYLCKSVEFRHDTKALDLYAAALQIDSVTMEPMHGTIARALAINWQNIWVQDQRYLDTAKLNLVRRFGEAARIISEQRRRDPAYLTQAAYVDFYRISCSESSHMIRLQGAKEIGIGGDEAFDALKNVLGPYDDDGSPYMQAEGRQKRGKRRAASKLDVARRASGDEHIAARRKMTFRAWLAPLLVGSVTAFGREARANLERWLQFVREEAPSGPEPDLRVPLEIALAQGFKYAANRRPQDPYAQSDTRAYLAERAGEVLEHSSSWFSQLTLVHALCLWAVADGTEQQAARRIYSDDHAALKSWGDFPLGRPKHPFVAEALKLAKKALKTRQPERFIWIDESETIGRIGSGSAGQRSPRNHHLWVSPSTGWTALDPLAQELLADVYLLLNLTEHGMLRSDRDRRLQRTNWNYLPPCLAGDRSPLDPARTTGMVDLSEPGSNCGRGCPFQLCPYPPQGATYLVELSESFCRRQALISAPSVWRKSASWRTPGRSLVLFWNQMGERAANVNVGSTIES